MSWRRIRRGIERLDLDADGYMTMARKRADVQTVFPRNEAQNGWRIRLVVQEVFIAFRRTFMFSLLRLYL